jgi:hypothetical protein
MITSPQSTGTLRHGLTFTGGLLLSGANFEDGGVREILGLVLTLAGVIWSVIEKSRRPGSATAAGPQSGGGPGAGIVPLLLCGLFGLLLIGLGCARFQTVQRDISGQTNGVARTIETTATATTFAASKQALSAWKASQTDKSQMASVGSVNQESDASGLIQGLLALGRLAAALQGVPLPAGAAPAAPAADGPATRSGPPASATMAIPLEINITPNVQTPAARPSSR